MLTNASDDRSKWVVESTTLSTEDIEVNPANISVFPNPTSKNFTITLNGIDKANIVIHNMLGKVIYVRNMTEGRLVIENNGHFTSGVYFIKVIDDFQRVHHSKLVVR
ncbi:T9SS type A sorting domain-containing protein [Seonamhaeicola sediminis]|nr:T9SS type A sorting domain-containing protein [Seonamhaeicola sediminis]